MRRLVDFLTGRTLYSVDEDQSVAEVAHAMAELRVGAILVLRGGELRGLFSERDLLKRVVVEGRDPRTTLVGDVMTRELATISHEASFEEAMQMMYDCGCRHLPVMREDRVVGMVSMRDLMAEELASHRDEIRHMREYISTSA
jgi:CBS domain-containing protein